MRIRPPGVFAATWVLSLLTVWKPAQAQLHGDLGARAGVTKRFLSEGQAGFGPLLWIDGHIAVLPFVRAGLYGSFEGSQEIGARPARLMGTGGFHLKLISPVPRGRARVWAFAGAGCTFVDQAGLGGRYLDVPVGLGASYRLRRTGRGPELAAEAGARFGAAFGGKIYQRPAPSLPRPGEDVAGIFLTVGVTMEL